VVATRPLKFDRNARLTGGKMAPKKVIVKIPDLAADIKTAITKLTKARLKVSIADRTKIDLEIGKLRSFEREMKGLCHGKMTHAFNPVGGDPE
jgi:hypothetical protein